MKNICKFFCLLIVVAFSFASCKQQTAQNQTGNTDSTVVVGYVAGWTGMPMKNVNVNKLTHINYAFANIKNGKAIIENAKDSVQLAELVAKKADNPKLKVLVSVGGWVWSNWFSDAALTAQSREVFAKSCIELMIKHKLDGIDLDWEYPGQIGEDNVFRPEDKHNFTLMLAEIRRQMDEMGAKNNNAHYLLTIATGADQTYINHTELGEAQKSLDFINIMTYDFYSGLDKVTGHHANLNQPASGKSKNSLVQAVDYQLKAGVPASKLVLGIPFYGRMWTGVDPKENGCYQAAKSVGMIVDYNVIVDKYLNKGFVRYWDEAAQAPYLWNKDSCQFISYEDSVSLAKKMDFRKKQKLRGIMFWEYALDKDKQLLNTIQKHL